MKSLLRSSVVALLLCAGYAGISTPNASANSLPTKSPYWSAVRRLLNDFESVNQRLSTRTRKNAICRPRILIAHINFLGNVPWCRQLLAVPQPG